MRFIDSVRWRHQIFEARLAVATVSTWTFITFDSLAGADHTSTSISNTNILPYTTIATLLDVRLPGSCVVTTASQPRHGVILVRDWFPVKNNLRGGVRPPVPPLPISAFSAFRNVELLRTNPELSHWFIVLCQ